MAARAANRPCSFFGTAGCVISLADASLHAQSSLIVLGSGLLGAALSLVSRGLNYWAASARMLNQFSRKFMVWTFVVFATAATVLGVAEDGIRGNAAGVTFRLVIGVIHIRWMFGGIVRHPNTGQFAGLTLPTLQELVWRVPLGARIRRLAPRPGGCQLGVEYTWKSAGLTWKLRIHDPDPSAAAKNPASNSGRGWTFRLERGTNYMDCHGTFHPPGRVKTHPVVANDTHMPVADPGTNPIFPFRTRSCILFPTTQFTGVILVG